jgi:hypothetical protein
MTATAAQLTAAAKAFTPELVTKLELTELANWERKYVERKKKVSEAEKELEFRRIQLAEKVLGVKSKDELKELSPEQLQKRFAKRWENGVWKTERDAPEFEFSETSHGRYPAWAQLYIAQLGATAAARISAETPTTYSYCVTVSLPVVSSV